ncbi:MAG TPA: 4'-phosphopantetheinyl transferase superfamily protein [Burkholderiaceae bacterium]|nr:4'-phosphopantetheinyl transferase superfamily protein [Burkholderiaceae bacterium]
MRRAGARGTWVGSRADRAPDWPAGFAGSITHGAGLVAVAVGRSGGGGVGIDVEALLGEADRLHVEASCLTPAERQRLEPLPQAGQVALATLLFSAKEAFFKCLHPAVRCWFDFVDAEAVAVDPVDEGAAGRLRLRLLKHLAAGFGAGYELEGTFRFEQGRVFAAFER